MEVPLNVTNFARWLKQTSPTEPLSQADTVIRRYVFFLGADDLSKQDKTRARWIYGQYKQGGLT